MHNSEVPHWVCHLIEGATLWLGHWCTLLCSNGCSGVLHKVDKVEVVAFISGLKIKSLLWTNIVCKFDVLRILISDNDTQFTSRQVKQMCNEFNIKQIFTSVEHPQMNRQVEKKNRVILQGLKRMLNASKGEWPKEISRILWSYLTTSQSTTRETSLNLVYKTDTMICIEIIKPSLQKFSASHLEEEIQENLDMIEKIR